MPPFSPPLTILFRRESAKGRQGAGGAEGHGVACSFYRHLERRWNTRVKIMSAAELAMTGGGDISAAGTGRGPRHLITTGRAGGGCGADGGHYGAPETAGAVAVVRGLS